jgi:predicted transcriptional regulator
VNTKEVVRDLLEKLPEEASLLDIAHELEFLDGIRTGLQEADRGELFSADELRAQVRQWANSK